MTDTFELLPDPAIRVDGHGIIREINQALISALRWEERDLVGRPCETTLAPRNLVGEELLSGGWRRALTFRSVRRLPPQELSVQDVDGKPHSFVLTANIVRDDRGAVRDVVATMRAPFQQGESTMQVIGAASHEVRSPLTSIKGYSQLLAHRWESLEDDDKKMMIGQIVVDADRVNRLLTELLYVARLDTNRLPIRPQLIDLSSLVRKVITHVKELYPELEASVSMPEALPRVLADPEKVEHALSNLIENACKYASPGDVRVSGARSANEVMVSVSDSGEGIGSAELRRIFTRGHRSKMAKPTGTGLGLHIDRGLMEAHGGRLEAESTPGSGSTFRIVLPIEGRPEGDSAR